MVTPITRDNQVDPQGIAQLTNMLIEKGVNCLYPCGTTGEMLRLSLAERKLVAETVVKTAAGTPYSSFRTITSLSRLWSSVTASSPRPSGRGVFCSGGQLVEIYCSGLRACAEDPHPAVL